MEVNKELRNKKEELLKYFRSRAEEYANEIIKQYGVSEHKKRASEINNAVKSIREALLNILNQKAKKEQWRNQEILECVLLIYYVSYIVMLEFRNEMWPYEYMTFSRRIGELWEPFCKLPFQYPLEDIELFTPPTFKEVKQKLTKEIEEYIESLPLTTEQKAELMKYYKKVWSLVTSGDIKLELDLHFIYEREKFVVDLKSGFHSNEKGNTNRLLLVGAIYKNLEEDYRMLMLVRSKEDENNHYLQTLKKSGIWEVFCGDEAYVKIKEYSGFDIKGWIDDNIDWQGDISSEFYSFLKSQDLLKYLRW